MAFDFYMVIVQEALLFNQGKTLQRMLDPIFSAGAAGGNRSASQKDIIFFMEKGG